MSNIRVLLADDHAIIREGLRSMIDAQPDMEVVGEVDNGRAAWLKTKELRPDVVVMDVSMPEMNGAQAAERLSEECPDVKVLALTVHEDKGYLRRLLKAGASGYVLKRAAVDDLARALRVVASGGTYIDPALAERVVGGYLRTHAGAGHQRQGELSDREVEVLRLIAWGYSNKEIAAQLDISVRTVETYKVRLMEKLDFHSRSEIVRYALQQGWLEEA
jgi:DNA-binding NarL/FixJ family response regulator